MHLKISSAKWRPFYLSLSVLNSLLICKDKDGMSFMISNAVTCVTLNLKQKAHSLSMRRSYGLFIEGILEENCSVILRLKCSEATVDNFSRFAVNMFCNIWILLAGHRRAIGIACGQTSSMAVLDNGDVSTHNSGITCNRHGVSDHRQLNCWFNSLLKW